MEQTGQLKNHVDTSVLGPFIGHTTSTSSKIWVHVPPFEAEVTSLRVTFRIDKSIDGNFDTAHVKEVKENTSWATLAEFSGLEPNTKYFYRIEIETIGNLTDVSPSLEAGDLYFTTLENGHDSMSRLDFLLLSCHNPEAGKLKSNPLSDGFEVWSTIPQILRQNPDIKFALLGGDQVYLDDAASKYMGKPEIDRSNAILAAYRAHWSHQDYRKVLCSLPSYLMWDDHDIVDGWGSERSSFTNEKSSTFKAEWLDWFKSAKHSFWNMQAARNPDTFGLAENGPFDTCFTVGRSAFVLADLRSNRNYRRKEIWLDEQIGKIKKWISEQNGIDTLFFLTPVVFAHGDPKSETNIGIFWPLALGFVDWLKKTGKLIGLVSKWDKSIGDLRDDLDDAWFSEPNRDTAAKVLDLFFQLQIKQGISVVILSGDIHTSGHSEIYSENAAHGESAIIPHIVSSPVAYSPFNWLLEAFFRTRTKTTRLDEKGYFKAQISHHFGERCATVISLRRPVSGEMQLKVKFYREGFEEPTTTIFDLLRRSHREQILWAKRAKIDEKSAPESNRAP